MNWQHRKLAQQLTFSIFTQRLHAIMTLDNPQINTKIARYNKWGISTTNIGRHQRPEISATSPFESTIVTALAKLVDLATGLVAKLCI